MRKLFSLVLVMALSFSLVACGTLNNNSTPAVESDVESTDTSVERDPVVTGDTMQIGTNEFGYVNVPSDWVKFTDVGNPDAYQYSDKSGSFIITLSNDARSGASSGEQWAEYIMRLMQDYDSDDYEYDLVDFLGYDCYQCMGSFPDGTIWIVHIFEVEDGSIRYVSFEGPFDETFLDLYIDIYSSYTTTA